MVLVSDIDPQVISKCFVYPTLQYSTAKITELDLLGIKNTECTVVIKNLLRTCCKIIKPKTR